MRRILLTFLFALSLMAVLPQRMSAAANIEIIDETIYEKFKAKYISKSINLDKSLICKECNWPVIDIEIKDEFRHYKDNELYNYFIYCTNKQCINHKGQGYKS